MAREYKDLNNAKCEKKISEMLRTMPRFCRGYIISISGYNKPLTQLAYLQRLEFFFYWLHDNNSYFSKSEISDYTVDSLAMLKKVDFEEFLHHIDVYGAIRNDEIDKMEALGKVIMPAKASTRNNYLSALNSLYNYFLDNEYIDSSPVSRIKHKKEDKKIVIALDEEQKNNILDTIECGSAQLSNRQELFREKTYVRDKAIYILAMHTGIRVSELVSLDVDDLDFRKHCFVVIRKRGKEDVVYMDDTSEQAILDWLEIRRTMNVPDDEDALFLSMQGKKIATRLSVRSVERMVKKYAQIGAPELGTKVTPHKLRSTCVTDIINKTGDIYYAKTVAGHENIATTTLYTKEDEKKKEQNRNLLS